MKQIKFNAIAASKNILFLSLFLALIGSGLYFSIDASQKPQYATADARDFSIMSYNVENLFDAKTNSTEYPEFIPNFKNWNEEAYNIKKHNILRVIKDANPDILAMQEIENKDVLKDLQKELKGYEWSAITDKKDSPVQIALLSRFPIKSSSDIDGGVRPILKVVLDINGSDFIVYANHWRAKPAPESKRLESAKELKLDIAKLEPNSKYVIVGDLNENYNECYNFEPRLNDTNGVLALEHIIGTAKSRPNEPCKLADKADILIQSEAKLHYDTWLEIAPSERWSEVFGKEYGTLDHIILPKSLFSDKGINYKDESFTVFKPSYILKKGRPFKWNTANKAGEINEGYSDHLPLIARFSKSAYTPKANMPAAKLPQTVTIEQAKQISISKLYDTNTDITGDFLITDAIVTYKGDKYAIIKRSKDRAVEVYDAPKEWNEGDIVTVRFSKYGKFNGKTEISKIFDFTINGKKDVKQFYLNAVDINLSSPKYENEIITNIQGIYSKGRFYYNENESVKVYFKNKALRPKGMAKIKINSAQLSKYNDDEQIIFTKESDFSLQ